MDKNHRKALADNSDIVRTKAAYSLTNLDPKKFKDLLNDAINSSDAKIRSGIAEGVHNFPPEHMKKAINYLLHDPSDVVRRKLFNSIESIKDLPETISVLIDNGIKDTSAAVRLNALNATNLLSIDQALQIRTKATKDSEPIVRAKALELLSQTA